MEAGDADTGGVIEQSHSIRTIDDLKEGTWRGINDLGKQFGEAYQRLVDLAKPTHGVSEQFFQVLNLEEAIAQRRDNINWVESMIAKGVAPSVVIEVWADKVPGTNLSSLLEDQVPESILPPSVTRIDPRRRLK